MTQVIRTVRSIRQWLGLVWPPAWMGVTGVLMWAICEFCLLAMRAAVGDAADPRLFHFPRDAMLLFSAVVYGGYRVVRFHPVFCNDYHGWLRLSPWTSSKPLPLGPVHLAPQDALFLGLLVLLRLYEPVLPLTAIFLGFLAAYLGCLLLAHIFTGPTWIAYVLAFGLAAAVRCLWWSPEAALWIVAPLAVFSQIALSISLARFPWLDRLRKIRTATAFAYDKQDAPRRTASDWPLEIEFADILRLWPRGVLNVRQRDRLLGRVDFVLISLLSGTVAYCVTAGVPAVEETRKVLTILVAAVSLGVPIARLSVYTAWHHPPISLLGRIATGQWIIPGYDVVFLTPLATLLTALATYVALSGCGISFGITVGVVLGSTLLVAFLGGPTKRRWQLTCPCQLVGNRAGMRAAEQI